ncbi:MAG: hypothetical protein GX896_04625 [Clostridiales bacterium]|nr:hypothetical protein [Clostridiales bacterium]
MITYLRYAISPTKNPRTNKEIPEIVKREAEKLFNQCRKYCINEKLKLVLMPIDTKDYKDVMSYINQYSEWASGLIMYEHKFNKKEMEEAKFLLLKSTSLICPEKGTSQMFSRCCDSNKLIGNQEGFFKIRKNDMEKKMITGTSAYRYFISKEIKEKLISDNISNIKFLPVYNMNNDEVLAYQIEAKKLMPLLAEYNKWRVYKGCLKCGKLVYNPIQDYAHPLIIPKEFKAYLSDFNATFEVFTEICSRYYIISKKFIHYCLKQGQKN